MPHVVAQTPRPPGGCCVYATVAQAQRMVGWSIDRGGRAGGGPVTITMAPQEFFFNCSFYASHYLLHSLAMSSFKSITFVPREVKASPDLLEKIYEASRLGLRGDALAYAAGLQPVEFRQLCQLDNAASIAEAKGRADSEVEAASVLRNAALEGDAKSALELLKHLHGWVAKTQVQVDVKSQISIVAALQEAESRVLTGRVFEAERVALTEDASSRQTLPQDSHATADL